MAAIGDWIKDLLDRLGGLIPVRIVSDWEQGIRTRAGRVTGNLTSANGLFGTGIHFFWPLIGDIIKDETNIRVAQTSLQTCTTADGRDVTFSLGVRYRVRDLAQCWARVHDYESAVLDAVRCAAGQVVLQTPHGELTTSFCSGVEGAAKAATRGWGLDLISLAMTNLTSARPIRLITDTAGVPGTARGGPGGGSF